MVDNLYIHIPFCRKKCDYCSFFSVTDNSLGDKFLAKLISDIARTADLYGKKFKTLYIGGGTPTLLTEKQLEMLFAGLERYLDLKSFEEISIETNPESLNREKLAIVEAYVNRISMGVQSFNENLRKILGRDCSNTSIYRAIELIGESKIKNFNIDLIYAIPAQTIKDFEYDINEVKKAGAKHLSCYNLTIEEQTRLAGKNIKIDEDSALELYNVAVSNGFFKQYEVSNYAISEEFQCRHNKNIWQGGTLLGLGPAASSFDGEKRFTQSSSIENYLADKGVEYDIISFEERRNEIFAINLRTCMGWSRAEFEKLYPNAFDLYLQKVAELSLQYPQAFDYSLNHIRLTAEGLLFWDTIAMEILG